MNLKCVWIYALISFVYMMLPVLLFAQEEGLSGLVQYTYQEDKNKDINAQSNKDSFIQEYRLRYQGNIYSPRLLMYNIGGSFIKEDSNINESGSGDTTTAVESTGYDIKLDFIQATKYPFTIFKDIIAWQKAHHLALQTYKLTKNFPRSEEFGLVSQMRRCAVSIPSNIAEGFKRKTAKDRKHFYNIAEGSLEELKYQLLLSKDLDYLTPDDYTQIDGLTSETGRLLFSWRSGAGV